jgi:hypothetical protein
LAPASHISGFVSVLLQLLLPLAQVLSQSAPVETGTHEVVERALNQGVRTRLDAGWAVADMRTEKDDYVVTVVRGDAIERHVMTFATQNTYRVEPADKLPDDLQPPDDTMLRTLASSRGAFEVEQACSDYYALPYILQDEAIGETAGALVARTLATADDLLSATKYNNRATYVFEKGTVRLDLRVWLDAKGTVLEARIRRFHGEIDPALTYKRPQALKALRTVRVLAIEDDGTTLKTSKGKVELDPDHKAFGSEDNGEYEGCGC